jgi:hypothetical protein
MIKYQQHIDELVSWYVKGVLYNILFSPEQYAPTYYREPHNILVMPIVRKIRLSNKKQINLRCKIKELFVATIPHVWKKREGREGMYQSQEAIPQPYSYNGLDGYKILPVLSTTDIKLYPYAYPTGVRFGSGQASKKPD